MSAWISLVFVILMFTAIWCIANVVREVKPFTFGRLYGDVLATAAVHLCVGAIVCKTGSKYDDSFALGALLVMGGIVLLITWVLAYSRYLEKARIERVKSRLNLYSVAMENDFKRLIFMDGDYASALNDVRVALAQTEHWSHYEPRLLDVILNESDLDNVLDIMLAGRGRIRSDAVMTGYSADSVDVAARVEFLQVLQSMLGSCGVTRPLFAIQHDSGEILRYAWADTPAAKCSYREKRVPIDR